MTEVSWTDDRVEKLKKLWEAGLSASQIAAELGGITRNAAIGKVHRLGLSGRKKTSPTPVVRKRKIGSQPASSFGFIHQRKSAVARQPPLPRQAEAEFVSRSEGYDNVIPMHQRLSLAELTEATCHWPVGDPQDADFYFCGGRALEALPYCAHHSRIAYQPAADRRRGKRK